MFETPPTVAQLVAAVAGLRRLDPEVDDAVRVDRIRALEELKAAAAAAQARETALLHRSQREQQAAAGVPPAGRGSGVAAQVALARRDSPHRGGRHLGLARALVDEMPCTLAALEAGRISEWRATLLVRETAVLTREDREAVDAEVAADHDELERLGDRALVARVREVAYRLDPRSVVERARRAEGERCVTVRPAPDTMAYLTALLPVRQAVSVQVTLQRAAEAARCRGDERSRGQVMADTLVAAVAGDADRTSEPGTPVPPDVAVHLVMTDRALLDGDDEPARLDGVGTVPAAWARDLVARTLEEDGRVFVSRLLLDRLGALVALESRARRAPAGLARLVRLRDGGTCRTPWCDAPVRHVDHVVAHAAGGETSAANTAGLCEACNLTKESVGWSAGVVDGSDRHTTEITTPTGHRYPSSSPPLPGGGSRAPRRPGITWHLRGGGPFDDWLNGRLAA